MRFAPLLALLTLSSCGNPAPTCAPRGDAYTVCSDKSVWECPAGPADVVQFNKDIDTACQTQADPVKCVLDAKYKFVDMVVKAKCGEGGQVCVESPGATSKSASCQMP